MTSNKAKPTFLFPWKGACAFQLAGQEKYIFVQGEEWEAAKSAKQPDRIIPVYATKFADNIIELDTDTELPPIRWEELCDKEKWVLQFPKGTITYH